MLSTAPITHKKPPKPPQEKESNPFSGDNEKKKKGCKGCLTKFIYFIVIIIIIITSIIIYIFVKYEGLYLPDAGCGHAYGYIKPFKKLYLTKVESSYTYPGYAYKGFGYTQSVEADGKGKWVALNLKAGVYLLSFNPDVVPGYRYSSSDVIIVVNGRVSKAGKRVN